MCACVCVCVRERYCQVHLGEVWKRKSKTQRKGRIWVVRNLFSKYFWAERDEVGTALWSHVRVVVVDTPPPQMADPTHTADPSARLTPHGWPTPHRADPLCHVWWYHVITWQLTWRDGGGRALPLRWRSVPVGFVTCFFSGSGGTYFHCLFCDFFLRMWVSCAKKFVKIVLKSGNFDWPGREWVFPCCLGELCPVPRQAANVILPTLLTGNGTHQEMDSFWRNPPGLQYFHVGFHLPWWQPRRTVRCKRGAVMGHWGLHTGPKCCG